MTITNKLTGSLVFLAACFHGLESSYAFQMHRRISSPTKIFADTDSFREFDLDLAEDLASNFGKYSVEEIEACIDGLHARRVQHLAFAEDVNSPDIVKERFLEVELNMQLDALKQEMSDSYLFPDDYPFDPDLDTDLSIDGLLSDNIEHVELPPLRETEISTETVVEKKQDSMFDILATEGFLESIGICAFIGFLMLFPESF